MQERHGMNSDDVEALLLSNAEYRQEIIDAITRPAEALPWHRYRNIFITQERIDSGVEFYNTHKQILSRAQTEFGVDPEVITAVIGVETFYGRYRGQHRIIDALRTLGFSYPPRQDFFRRELEAFLLLSAEEGLNPAELKGSYAGAMGVSQFISSSYRAYAVDFSESGQRDLFSDMADAIGSVANYFAEHRWQADARVALPARVEGEAWREFLAADLKPRHTVANLRAAGVTFDEAPADELTVRLLELEGQSAPEYWVTFENFYTITRYNHSALYAMAVFQLAEAIKEANQ
ncbi:MAG: lytic murein transglycosylase B [Gammaproteobacteria bacterium]|nr:lytic murein transglycosylase B [Gammaproteobacteria bacterium]